MFDYTMLAYNVIRCLTNNGLQSSVKKLCKAITTNLKDKQGVHMKACKFDNIVAAIG